MEKYVKEEEETKNIKDYGKHIVDGYHIQYGPSFDQNDQVLHQLYQTKCWIWIQQWTSYQRSVQPK